MTLALQRCARFSRSTPSKGRAPMSGRVETVLRSMTYAIVATLLALPSLAQQAGEQVEGVITEVDGRSLTVDREGGGQVTARLGARTHVVVQPRQGGHYPNASA